MAAETSPNGSTIFEKTAQPTLDGWNALFHQLSLRFLSACVFSQFQLEVLNKTKSSKRHGAVHSKRFTQRVWFIETSNPLRSLCISTIFFL
jgi:hypothetical protein